MTLLFLNDQLEYHPVINLQVKKYTKKVVSLNKTFIVDWKECKVCSNGPTCCCVEVKNLKLKRKPGTSSGCPKLTVSIDRKRKPENVPSVDEVPNKVTIIGS